MNPLARGDLVFLEMASQGSR